MTDITFRPITRWPEPFTDDRQRSRFDSTFTATKTLLLNEASHLVDRRYYTSVVVHLAITESDLRRDGQLRANARPEHPGVMAVIPDADSFEVHTDQFTDWHDNLRACALAMQALRSVDRYGVANGRQYAGFKAIGSGIALGESVMTVEEAADWIARHSEAPDDPTLRQALISNPAARTNVTRRVAKRLHPDVGGDAAMFARLQQAREVLEEHA